MTWLFLMPAADIADIDMHMVRSRVIDRRSPFHGLGDGGNRAAIDARNAEIDRPAMDMQA